MQEFLKDKVKAAYWVPKIYTFLDALPKTSVLKFDKKGLRKMFADGKLEVK
jgi:fatty-acyl-CoA synthase